jgi:hypothetical protein
LISSCGSSKKVSTVEIDRNLEEEIIGNISKDSDSKKSETTYSTNDSISNVDIVITETEFEIVTNLKDSSIVSVPKREIKTEIKTSERTSKETGAITSDIEKTSLIDSLKYKKSESIVSLEKEKSKKTETSIPKYIFFSLLLLLVIFVLLKFKKII